MSRERVTQIGIVFISLTVGLLVGWRIWPAPDNTVAASFRWWFWENRTLDLAVHVGLIFAGALGIAALLPRDKEGDE